MHHVDIRETVNVIVRTWPGAAAVLRENGLDDLLGLAGTRLEDACRAQGLKVEEIAREIERVSEEKRRSGAGGADQPARFRQEERGSIPDVAAVYRASPPPAARQAEAESAVELRGASFAPDPAFARIRRPTSGLSAQPEQKEAPPPPAVEPTPEPEPAPKSDDDIPDVSSAFKAKPPPRFQEPDRRGRG